MTECYAKLTILDGNNVVTSTLSAVLYTGTRESAVHEDLVRSR